MSSSEVTALRKMLAQDEHGGPRSRVRKGFIIGATVVVLLGCLTVLVFLLLSIKNKKPLEPPPFVPHKHPGGGGGGGDISWGVLSPDMPSGCQTEPSPAGLNFQWGKPDVSFLTDQPPYVEQINMAGMSSGGCGGSLGMNPGSLGTPQSGVLICPTGVISHNSSDAKFKYTNMSMEDNGTNPTSMMALDQYGDHLGWCYWANQYVSSAYLKTFPVINPEGESQNFALPPTLQPNSGPAIVPAQTTVNVSFSQTPDNAISMVSFTCSQYGIAKFEVRESYPPCQFEASVCGLLKALSGKDLPWWALPLLGVVGEAVEAESILDLVITEAVKVGKCVAKKEGTQYAEEAAKCAVGQVLMKNSTTGALKCMEPGDEEGGWSQMGNDALRCLGNSSYPGWMASSIAGAAANQAHACGNLLHAIECFGCVSYLIHKKHSHCINYYSHGDDFSHGKYLTGWFNKFKTGRLQGVDTSDFPIPIDGRRVDAQLPYYAYMSAPEQFDFDGTVIWAASNWSDGGVTGVIEGLYNPPCQGVSIGGIANTTNLGLIVQNNTARNLFLQIELSKDVNEDEKVAAQDFGPIKPGNWEQDLTRALQQFRYGAKSGYWFIYAADNSFYTQKGNTKIYPAMYHGEGMLLPNEQKSYTIPMSQGDVVLTYKIDGLHLQLFFDLP